MDGKFASSIVKATYGTEIRKWKSNSHGKHSDLVNEVIGEFGIEAEKVHLKYKDSDGDLIELSSDESLELAIELEKALNIVVINDSEDLPTSLNEFRSSLTSLIADATRLYSSLDTLNLSEKKPTSVNTRDSVSSPIKTEPIATIDPSSLEEIQLNEPNGTIHESKPPTYENNGIGIQSFPIKSSQFDGPIGYSPQQQNLPPLNNSQPPSHSQPPIHSQPPVSAPLPPPPTSNYGQQQFQPPSVYGQQPPSSFNPNQQQPPSSFNPGQQQQLNSFQRPPGAPSMAPPLQPPSSIPSSQPPNLPPVQPPASNQPPTSMPLPPTSNYGQAPHHQQFAPPTSNYGQQQFQPPSGYGQQPPSSFNPGQQLPPQNFNPGQQPQGNPFQRPGMTPTQLPPSAMPMPPTSYGQQQQNY